MAGSIVRVVLGRTEDPTVTAAGGRKYRCRGIARSRLGGREEKRLCSR
jgi:hypothetical protein